MGSTCSCFLTLPDAALLGDAAAIRRLHERGADLESVDQWGNTAMHKAASRGNKEALRMLHSLGANVHAVNKDHFTPLHIAVSSNPEASSCIPTLVELGANIEHSDLRGNTAMHEAASSGNTLALRRLHSLGANVHAVNNDHFTPLHIAVSSSPEASSCIPTLVELGANVEHSDLLGNTAMHVAASRGNNEALRMLHSLGANVHAVNKDHFTPLHIAVCSNPEASSCIPTLVELGANVEHPDLRGNTAMHEATSRGNTLALRLLHSLGANVNAVNYSGHTPLCIAVCEWSAAASCISTLVELGANVDNADQQGNTAIHEAAYRGNNEALRILRSLGANVNAVNVFGQTPLRVAILGQTAAACCIPTLVELGANVHHVDESGNTAMHEAASRGNKRALRMLRSVGANAPP